LWRWFPVVSGVVHARLAFIPVMQWSGNGFALANLVLVALLLGFSPFPFLNHTWTWKIVSFIAVVETLNSLNHIGAALVTGGYFPGSITALLILALSVLIWARRPLRRMETK
jgi:hypothetical protein